MGEGGSTVRIGFIGLGVMGGPMAANLVAAGHDVVGYNRSRPAVDRLVEAGGTAAGSMAEALAGAEAVITMLPDSPDVESVVLGDGGVLAAAGEGLLLVDCSTIRPQVARSIADAASGAGMSTLDAPVSGGQQGAVDGTLSIMAGGADEAFEAGKPLLDVLGATVVHVGPAGSGQTVKAANQLIVAGALELLAESIVFLEAEGVDTEAATRVLSGGLAGSAILDRKAPSMLAREFSPGFRMELHHKDLGILTAAAREAGVTVPLGAEVAQLVGAMVARGDGELDHSALLELVEALSGR
jgi:2-hydroxy-3-oxopropionate reductase